MIEQGDRRDLRGGVWRHDPVYSRLVWIEFVALIAVAAVLITFFARVGFWPWLVMAAAIVVGWVAAVLILVPRSAPDR